MSRMNPTDMYGIAPVAPALMESSPPALAQSAGPSTFDAARPWSPDSPIFWLVGLAAATLGLIGFATSVRVGPARAAIAVGAS
jgi:hypothetical protein